MVATCLFPSLEYFTLAFDGSLADEVPDSCLVFYDGDDGKPASLMGDEGSPAANYAKFAKLFAGVSKERKITSDGAGTLDVVPVWVGEMSCDSQTWEFGDFISAIEASNGTELENLKVAKTTTRDAAIGYCIQREGSAVTKVLCVLFSQIVPNAMGSSRIKTLTSQALAFGDFTDNGNATGYIDFSESLPAGALVLGWDAVVSAGFTGNTTAVMQVGTTDVDKFTADATQSCLAAATVGSAAAPATAFLAAATAPRVTVTGDSDFTAISAGSMIVRVHYIDLLNN